MYVIGTAGHVDHGKSALVQALTGIDPDRLREEKERGLTIDLGFAWLTLPGGAEVSIVDVPGHERFIKNMLAGVGGIDLALLVIAADEGVMPQTREHLAIIDLLGIEHGVVALTKSDLVEPEFLELAMAEAEEAVSGTSLKSAPVVTCSATTGAGLEALTEVIEAELAKTPKKRDTGRPRLPIDRVFTMAGFGTVVTGTLIDGSLSVGQEVDILPGGLRSRVRGLQSHGRKTEIAAPGRRTAVNLAGVAVDELRRGMVVTTQGWLKPTHAVDVRLRAVRYLGRPVRHNLSITFHTGAAEVEGRLLLLDRESITPGEAAWAQVRLSEPVAAIKGDRCIIRDANDTLGGGVTVDTDARRHRRMHGPTLAALETLEKGSPGDLVAMAIGRLEPVEFRDLLQDLSMDERQARQAVAALVTTGDLVELHPAGPAGLPLLNTAEGLRRQTESLRSALAAYHRQFPLRAGMPREELRSRLKLPVRAFEMFVEFWRAAGELAEHSGSLSLPEHEPALDGAQLARTESFLASLRANPFAPATEDSLEDDLVAYLEANGDVVRVEDGVVFAAEAYRAMVEKVVAHLRENRTVTLAQVRDMFGTSRKYAQALLEHMDEKRVTRRVGDERVLR